MLGHDPGADHRGEQEEGADALRPPAAGRAARGSAPYVSVEEVAAIRGLQMSLERASERRRAGPRPRPRPDRRAPNALLRGCAGPDRADLAGRIVADGDDDDRARGAPSPANSSQLFGAKPVVSKPCSRRTSSAIGWTAPFGKLPAEKARKRPPPARFSSASARIERAELPVQRNRTLCGPPVIAQPQHFGRQAGMAGAQQAVRRHWPTARQRRALAVDRRLAVGVERLPDHAVGIGDPALLRLGVAAGGGALLEHRAGRRSSGGHRPRASSAPSSAWMPRCSMPFAGMMAGGDREIDARIVQHPLRIIGLHHARAARRTGSSRSAMDWSRSLTPTWT